MKWCQPHWDALRDAVKARKLWRFVPETGEEAFDNMRLELQGHGAGFDPLMGSMTQLTTTVLKNIEDAAGPMQALQSFGDPEWCPMCTVDASYEAFQKMPNSAEKRQLAKQALDAQGWIDRKMDGALTYAREQGWKLDGE